MNGKPVVRFDGVDDVLSNGTLLASVLFSASAYTIIAVVNTRASAASPTFQGIICDSVRNVSLETDSGGPVYNAHVNDGASKNATVVLVTGQPVIVTVRLEGGTLFINKNNGSDSSVASGNITSLTGFMALGSRYGAGSPSSWFDGDIAEIAVWPRALTSTERTEIHDSLRLKWLGGLPAQLNAARLVGSQRLRLYRRAPQIVELLATPEFADVEQGDDIPLTHSMVPGARAGLLRWQRGWYRVLRRAIIPETERSGEMVRLTLRDLRPFVTNYWDVAKSLKSSVVYADGIARLDLGNTRTFTRASNAWIQDPGDGRLVQLNYDTEKNDRAGLLIEGSVANEFIESGFKNGAVNTFTGWTKTGTESNGSNITEDTSGPLWDTSITPRVVKFLAGTPIHAADMYLQSTATASIGANTVGRLSIWHRDNAAPALSYALQRGVDSKWWRDSDQTWQAALTWNAMGNATTWIAGRYVSKKIDVGTGATTLTLRVGIPTTGTAGQINFLGHAQFEKQRFASSAILTQAAIVTRAVDQLLISNATGARAFPATRGTGKVTAVPLWDAADVTTVNKTVVYVGHDANNYEWVYFDGANARWVYERKVTSSIFRAVAAASPVRGTAYALCWRWTSSEGELGLTNFTASIFVDGVKGTDVATGAAPTEASSPNMEKGSKAAAEHFDGNLYAWDIVPFVLTDAEAARAA